MVKSIDEQFFSIWADEEYRVACLELRPRILTAVARYQELNSFVCRCIAKDGSATLCPYIMIKALSY